MMRVFRAALAAFLALAPFHAAVAQQGGTGAANLPYVSNGPGQGSSYKVLTVPGGGTGKTTFTTESP